MLITTAMLDTTGAHATVTLDLTEVYCADIERSGDSRGHEVCRQTRSCLDDAVNLLQRIHDWSQKLRGNAASHQVATSARWVNDKLSGESSERREEARQAMLSLKRNLLERGVRFSDDDQSLIEMVINYSLGQEVFELPKL